MMNDLILKLVNYILPNWKYNLKTTFFLVLLYFLITNFITYIPFIKNSVNKFLINLKNYLLIKIIFYTIESIGFIIYILQGILCFCCIITLFTVLIYLLKYQAVHLFIQVSCYQWILFESISLINYILFEKNDYKDTLFCLTFFAVLYII